MSSLSWISFIYHGVFLITPLFFFWGNSELFEFNKMLVVYVAATLIGALWLIQAFLTRKIVWKNHVFITLLLSFLGSQGISTLFSIHWRTSWLGYYSRLNGGFFSTLAYVVLALGLWNLLPKKKIYAIFLTNVLALLLVSLYALPEHFGFSPSCYLLRQTFDTGCWKQDVQARVFGTFGQPNWLASYIIGALPLVFFLRSRYEKKLRWIWSTVAGLSITVLWFTHSRSGIMALLGMILVFGFLLAVNKIRVIKKIANHRLFLLSLFTSAIVLVVLSSSLLHQRTMRQLNNLDLSQGTDSFSIRTLVWQGAFFVWQRYPLTGSGPATFAYSFYQDRPALHNLVSEWDFLYNKVHNEFLNYLAETGILGFSTYLAWLLITCWLLWKKGQQYASVFNSSWMVFLSLIGISIVHFFGFSIVATNLLLFTLPVIALRDTEIVETKIKNKLSWWQHLLSVIVALAAIYVMISITKVWQADRWYKKSEEQQKESRYTEAAQSLQKAIKLAPNEALYYDEFANIYSVLSFQYNVLKQDQFSKELATAAIQSSNKALLLNPRHLNFYKTRTRVFLVLAQSDPSYYVDAEHTLLSAIDLSPNDAKLYYNLGVVQKEINKIPEAQASLEKCVQLKPNYLKAREELADLYAQNKQPDKSLEQLQFIINHLSVNDPVYKDKYVQVEATASAIDNK